MDVIKALKRLKVETGSLACMGCGHEHNCDIKGCAILRAAIEEIERNQPVMKNATLLKGVSIPEQGSIEVMITSAGEVVQTGKTVRYDGVDCYQPVGPELIGSAIPAVDAVEVRHGRWEGNYPQAMFRLKRCSACETLAPEGWYCFFCGAMMDGEDGDA